MSLRRWALRAYRAPSYLCSALFDRLVVPLVVRLHGVEMGAGCRFAGMPRIQIADGARIVLGDRVLVRSRWKSSGTGYPHATMLCAVKPGALIRIENDAGVSGAVLTTGSEIVVGERSLLGAGCAVWGTDFHPLEVHERRRHPTAGAISSPVRIGCDVFVGGRAIILKGASIGDGAVVGAAAVVAGDVPPGAVVAGNPARIVRERTEREGREVSP